MFVKEVSKERITYTECITESGRVPDDDVGDGWDATGRIVGDRVHDSSADIAKRIVHTECQCWIQFDDFSDQASVGGGPIVDRLEDVCWLGVVWLEG